MLVAPQFCKRLWEFMTCNCALQITSLNAAMTLPCGARVGPRANTPQMAAQALTEAKALAPFFFVHSGGPEAGELEQSRPKA